jgi:hypothetical protein
MIKRILIFLALAVLVSSCGIPVAPPPTSTPLPSIVPPTIEPPTPTAEPPLPTVTPACVSPEPSEKDIDRALTFTGTIFETEWEKSYTVAENRVSVTWLNNPLGAVAYLEALIFPCGYEEPDLNNYYSAENWNTIFQYYESYELLNECKRDDGLRLYEFETQNQGFKYGVRYWVLNDTNTRVISTMIVFPLESKSLLDEYSLKLFPSYSTCP